MKTLWVSKIVKPRPKIKDEVLVVEFESAATRDSIKSSGFKLKGQRAGIRMEVPNHLNSDFHVLQGMSHRLKMANPDMKRSIKFDDENYGIYLDIKLPGQASAGYVMRRHSEHCSRTPHSGLNRWKCLGI